MVRAGSASTSSGMVLAAVAAAALLAGCGTQDDADGRAASAPVPAASESRAVEPARPAETAGGYNEVDIRFVEQMIPHHRQALTMADLALDRAGDDRVLGLAERIAATQGPELVAMEAWLTRRGLPVPEESTGHGHSHAGTTGMVTPFQMQLLEDSEGRGFDELFLVYMSNQHAGAVAMAEPAALGGADPAAMEMAANISVTQSAEIDRIDDILDGL